MLKIKNLKNEQKIKEYIHKNLIVGCEIEGVYNIGEAKIYELLQNKKSYHAYKESPLLKGFRIESDGSINNLNTKFKRTCVSEIIATHVKGADAFIEKIKEFETFFKTCGEKEKELNEVIEFNLSTGLHFHFSLPTQKHNNKKRFYSICLENVYKKTRSLMMRKISNAITLNEQEKAYIKIHYFRRYAKKTNKADILSCYYEKYKEFNFRSEEEGKGIEWRSPNLLNITKWGQFNELLNIYVECIKEFCFLATQRQQQQHKTHFKGSNLNKILLYELRREEKPLLKNKNVLLFNSEALPTGEEV